MKVIWEIIAEEKMDEYPYTCTDRLEVAGGWLIRTRVWSGDTKGGVAVAQTFIPKFWQGFNNEETAQN